MSKFPYGFIALSEGFLDIEKVENVRFIFDCYISGYSLRRICDLLQSKHIPSPTGQVRWSALTVSKLLSNIKYVPHIIDEEQYLSAQNEKQSRSNLDETIKARKTTRYSSLNVLSGLLVCSECGRNYRRYTRGSGEVVWRCANRIEHGKLYCKYSPSISENNLKNRICSLLGCDGFDPELVRNNICSIIVDSNCNLTVTHKH